jgi:hypothetical protein
MLNVLVQTQAIGGLGKNRGERCLAHLQRLAPEVVAIERDQIERVQEHASVVFAVADAIEARQIYVKSA